VQYRLIFGLFFFAFYQQFNLVRGSVMASSGSSPLPIAVAHLIILTVANNIILLLFGMVISSNFPSFFCS
jgi:hypothetical protein